MQRFLIKYLNTTLHKLQIYEFMNILLDLVLSQCM